MVKDMKLRYSSSVRLDAEELFDAGWGYKSMAIQLGLPSTAERKRRRRLRPLLVNPLRLRVMDDKPASVESTVESGTTILESMPRCK